MYKNSRKPYSLTILAAALLTGIFLAFAPHTVQAFDSPELQSIENTPSGIRLEWDSVPEATTYRVARSWYQNGEVIYEKNYASVSAPATSWTDTSVRAGDEYSYHVCSYDELGPTKYSTGGIRTIIRLLAPASAKVSVSGNFAAISWKKSTIGEYYAIEVSKDNTFSDPIRYQTTGAATSAKISGLAAGKTYYARVQLYDDIPYTHDYAHSDWSETVKFTISKKAAKKNGSALKYSGNKTVLQKMWITGSSPSCIELLNLVKANKNGSSMSFANRDDYREATDYYIMLTGDWKMLSRNKSDPERLTVTIKKNSDNRAYASGKKGCLKYYKKAYNLLAKAGVRSGMSKYKAALKIEAYIRGITRYGGKTPKHHTFYSILDNKKGVCQAYSQMFQVMCIQAGIDCRYCAGTYKGGRHAWNKFKANGRWYYIDVTFRDTASPKSWPVSKKKLKDHKAASTLKFIDACGRYNHGT